MSDVPQGPGWWLASDGKWYAPQQHPGFVSPTSFSSVPPADLSAVPTRCSPRHSWVEGWHPDPLGIHEERFFKQGKATPLVRDDGVGSYHHPSKSEWKPPDPATRIELSAASAWESATVSGPATNGNQTAGTMGIDVSGLSEGPGWWVASDGTWFPGRLIAVFPARFRPRAVALTGNAATSAQMLVMQPVSPGATLPEPPTPDETSNTKPLARRLWASVMVVAMLVVLVAAISLARGGGHDLVIHIVIVVVTALVGFFLLWIPNMHANRNRLHPVLVALLTILPSGVPFVIGLTGNYVGTAILLSDPVAWWLWIIAMRLAGTRGDSRRQRSPQTGVSSPRNPSSKADPPTPTGQHF